MNEQAIFIDGLLANLPEARQLKIKACILDIRELINHYGKEDAYFAIARVGAEIQDDEP